MAAASLKCPCTWRDATAAGASGVGSKHLTRTPRLACKDKPARERTDEGFWTWQAGLCWSMCIARCAVRHRLHVMHIWSCTYVPCGLVAQGEAVGAK